LIRFNNLCAAEAPLADEVRVATLRVLNRGGYVFGREVEQSETAFAAYHGIEYAVGVANGTDAIELALRAAGILSLPMHVGLSMPKVNTVAGAANASAIELSKEAA
jgi:hypothetical protein